MRKPEWEWSKDIPPSILNPPPPLPPNAMFPSDWTGGVIPSLATSLGPNDTNSISQIPTADGAYTRDKYAIVRNRVPGMPVHQAQQQFYYKGDLCGFVLPCMANAIQQVIMRLVCVSVCVRGGGENHIDL